MQSGSSGCSRRSGSSRPEQRCRRAIDGPTAGGAAGGARRARAARARAPLGRRTRRGRAARAGVPPAMLFVRSLNGGVSHSPDELSSPEDVALAVDVLADALGRLASS